MLFALFLRADFQSNVPRETRNSPSFSPSLQMVIVVSTFFRGLVGRLISMWCFGKTGLPLPLPDRYFAATLCFR